VSFLAGLTEEPWRYDVFAVLRWLERSFPDRPRIGDSASLRDEYVLLHQDPFMEFPASNLRKAERGSDGRFRVAVRFLGLLGPQGALPLATTEEAYGWQLARDDAFPRFLDLMNHRFLQLFFRAWADARPVAQHDRPDQDRFVAYVGAQIGLGSALYRDLDTVPDASKLSFAGLMAPQAKGASRLRSALGGMFGVRVEIDEFVGAYLKLDQGDWTLVGRNNSRLGVDMLMGASVFSVQDKFRVRIFTASMAQYLEFLPTGGRCEPLADLVFFYVGHQFDWEVELAIPAGAIEPVRLGTFGRLGWTSWMAPNWAETDRRYRCDARFHPAEILAEKRRAAAQPSRRR
jgi:type VI secretion system protein ImpH